MSSDNQLQKLSKYSILNDLHNVPPIKVVNVNTGESTMISIEDINDTFR